MKFVSSCIKADSIDVLRALGTLGRHQLGVTTFAMGIVENFLDESRQLLT